MKSKKIATVADLQAEKQKIKDAYLIRETELNTKLNYLQNNFGSILLRTLSFKKQNSSDQNESTENGGFISSLIQGFTGIDVSGERGEMLLSLAKTALPAIIISIVKNYITKKFSK
jgi:hypothetical protein